VRKKTLVASILTVALGAAAGLAAYWRPMADGLWPWRGAVAAGTALRADSHDGRGEVWERRPSAGKSSWGIRGSGIPESGSIWFDGFPGDSGVYLVELGAVLERDGDPAYKISAAGRVLGQGRYPYACGKLMCAASKRSCPDKAAHLNLGTHRIQHGERIEVWGRSRYPCGAHGAYARWFEVRFTRAPDGTGRGP